MTRKAREVLADCRLALSLLEEETDFRKWRIHWAAAVALIRAVGHVLAKVDGIDPTVRQIANAAFRRWNGEEPKHEIFREFIERERNNLLKEYAVMFTRSNESPSLSNFQPSHSEGALR